MTSLNLKGLTFMIADSSENIRAIMQGILRGFGATAFVNVGDGETAQNEILAKNVDVLFCEINLPKLDGFSLIKYLRRDETNPARFIPVIILTSHTQLRDVEECRDSGANTVIAKPLIPQTLHDRLSRIAREPRAFIQAPDYHGPDRRFKVEGYPDGVGRRSNDINEETPSDTVEANQGGGEPS